MILESSFWIQGFGVENIEIFWEYLMIWDYWEYSQLQLIEYFWIFWDDLFRSFQRFVRRKIEGIWIHLDLGIWKWLQVLCGFGFSRSLFENNEQTPLDEKIWICFSMFLSFVSLFINSTTTLWKTKLVNGFFWGLTGSMSEATCREHSTLDPDQVSRASRSDFSELNVRKWMAVKRSCVRI